MKKSPETDMDTGDLPARLDPVQPERLPSPAGSFDAIARYAPPAAGAPQDGDVLADLRRYLSAVWRYKWAVTGITVLGTAAGVAGKMLLPPNYVARATVWIQVPARPTRDEGPIWSGQLPISSGWTDLLHTNVVLEEVVRQQRLYVAPQEPRDSDALAGFGIKDRVRGGTYRLVVNDGGTAFTLEEMKAGTVQHGVTGDSVGAALGFAWVPPSAALSRGRRVEFTVSAPYEAARALGKRLKTSLDLDGNFLRLELGGPDAAGITAVVNAVAERFVAAAAELKRQNLTELTRILSGQLERAQANLRDAETALKTFRVSAVTEYADGAAPVTPNMQFPRDPVFAGLLDMKVSREQLRRDREAIARILAQGRDSAAGGLRRIPPLAVAETQLQRDVTLAEQVVTNLQQRYEEARLAEVSAIPDVRLIDPAIEPQQPAASWSVLLVALAFLGSLGAGVAGAVVRDRTDRRVHYPEHVTGTMGLAILGAVPHLARRRNGKEASAVLQVVEAVRGIRLNVLHAHGAGPAVLTVTSPGRSDGKSFLASNLALAFADAGFRTLLVDGDVRCGTLHRALKLARKPGLVDVLGGKASTELVVQPPSYRALSFIGSGTRTHTGPSLVSSAALPRLLASLRPGYDTIIVVSPPLAAGADAFAIGTATGSMVLVLRTGVSDRELAQTKLEVLAHLPIRILGAVLNDVRGGLYRYYSYYLEGYEVKEEPEPAWRLLRAPD